MILTTMESKVIIITHGLVLSGESLADMNSLLIELFDEFIELFGEDKAKVCVGNAYECAFMEVLKND